MRRQSSCITTMSYCLRNPLSTAERRRRTLVCLVTFCLFAAAAEAQDDSDQHGMPNMPGMSHETPAAGWLWLTDATDQLLGIDFG